MFSIPVMNPGALAVATLTCAAGNPRFVAAIVSTENGTVCEVTTAEPNDEAGSGAALTQEEVDVYALDVELFYNANLQDTKPVAVSLPPVSPGNRGACAPRVFVFARGGMAHVGWCWVRVRVVSVSDRRGHGIQMRTTRHRSWCGLRDYAVPRPKERRNTDSNCRCAGHNDGGKGAGCRGGGRRGWRRQHAADYPDSHRPLPAVLLHRARLLLETYVQALPLHPTAASTRADHPSPCQQSCGRV